MSVLYRCKYCGQFFEEITGERGFHLLTPEEAIARFGPSVIHGADEKAGESR